MALAPGEQGQLDRGGRLAGSLEAYEHEDCWRGWGVAQPLGVASEQLDQLEVDGPHDLLWRGQARRHLDADKSRPHPVDELLDDLEVDVGLEQRQPHLAEPGLHVLRPQHATAGDLLERGGQSVPK